MQEIVQPLLKWYHQNARALPWRKDKNPYHIWLSEVMLQQTRIDAVQKYYKRFLAALPTIQDLANIEEKDLLKLWEGLGYYSRARNLKKAAQIVMEKYQGEMPKHYEELVKLPGIGSYTAGAIASIAYDEKAPAIDGNVLRVCSRLLGSKKNVLDVTVKKEMTNLVTGIMPNEAGDFNQALMELGELVCIPNGVPLCEKCPLQKFCVAYQKNLTTEIPIRENHLTRKEEDVTVFVLTCHGKIAIRQRGKKGLLAGMYEFPNVYGMLKEKEILQELNKWQLEKKHIQGLPSHHHIFTHIEWNMIGYQIEVKSENDLFLWVKQDSLQNEYPIPSAFAPFLKHMHP